MGDILFLAHRSPFPPDRGDKIRAYNVLKYLAARKRVHLLAFADDPRDLKQSKGLASLTASRSIIWRSKSRPKALIEALAQRRPASLTAFDNRVMHDAVADILARRSIDTIYVFSGQMAQYVPAKTRGRVVMDFCDMDSLKFADYAKASRWPMRWLMRREANLLFQFERRVARVEVVGGAHDGGLANFNGREITPDLGATGLAAELAEADFVLGDKLSPVTQKIANLFPTREDFRRMIPAMLRGTTLGTLLGVLPGGGAVLSSFASYTLEKKLSKHPEQFGKGAIEGVAGPEAANNASAAGTLVPLLTLGLPTSATAAMMLAGFQQYGLNPGPLLFAERPDLVWGLIASLFIANGMLLVLNLPLVGLWVRLLAIPQPWLYAGILVFATMGTIAAKPSVVELSMLAAFGVMGFLMRRFDFPIAPVVIGLILGPIAESQLRRALAISLGDPMVLLQSPMSAVLLGIALIALLAPFVLRGLGRFKANED